MRDTIKNSNDVLRVWDRALSQAAKTRPRWRIWWGMIEWRWIKGTELGRR